MRQYLRIALGTPNVTEVLSCIDSDGNSWYEVPFLSTRHSIYG